MVKVLRKGFWLLAALSVVAALPVASQAAQRPWPDTSSGIHVFNDQLVPWMSDAQIEFAARNYAGSQKLLRSQADRLRRVSPGFLVLHYRLGMGLGYRGISGDCRPDGEPLRVIEGDSWLEEYPVAPDPQWFYSWRGQSPVIDCSWGWYLAELDNESWRQYWHGEVLRQMRANDNDGVFMDSLSVPNYLGGPDEYRPRLPYNPIDGEFEREWSAKIERWLSWLQGQQLGREGYLVPNVGSWITSRETTDYSAADGVMVEGFAIAADESPYALADWQLQANRILGLVGQGRAFIGQPYVYGARERLFALGSYLLLKGDRSFINLDTGLEPEWWPEYDVPIGRPIESAGADINGLDYDGDVDSEDSLYRRRFDNGLVLVNPTSPWDGSERTRTVDLGRSLYLAQPSGGGVVPSSGERPGTVSYTPVERVTLGPYSTAVLLDELPGSGGDGEDRGPDAKLPPPNPPNPEFPIDPRDLSAPNLSVDLVRHFRKKLMRKGIVSLKISIDEAAQLELSVKLILRQRSKSLKRNLDFTEGGARQVDIKLSRGLLRRLRRSNVVKVRVEATARDHSANISVKSALSSFRGRRAR